MGTADDGIFPTFDFEDEGTDEVCSVVLLLSSMLADEHEHSVTPLVQHLQPCLYPAQHSQLRQSGNQNSAADLVSFPLTDGMAP